MSLFNQLSNDLNPSYQPKHTRTAMVQVLDYSGDLQDLKVLYQVSSGDAIRICKVETKQGFDITYNRLIADKEADIHVACWAQYEAGELETEKMLYEAENN